MAIQVGTIFKWFSRDIEDERCEDGICVGIVQKVVDPDETSVSGRPTVMAKFWEKCDKHAQIDPDGTGPYDLEFIWQIGQLY